MAKGVTLHISDAYIEEQYRAKLKKLNQKKAMLNAAKRRAKLRELDFNLVENDIEIPEFCPIMGIRLQRRSENLQGAQDSSPTLDRINPFKGYIKDNVRVISYQANRYKNNMTRATVQRILDYMDGKL